MTAILIALKEVFGLNKKIAFRSRELVLNRMVAQLVKSLPALQKTLAGSLGGEYPLEEEMATQSSILVWVILWTEEPGRLSFMGSHESDTAE